MTAKLRLLIKAFGFLAVFLINISLAQAQQPDLTSVKVTRLLDKPIIGPDLHPSIGVNIQGPSLIKVPEWIENPLGKYYLYFADHKGLYIRLAYADELAGHWNNYQPGMLKNLGCGAGNCSIPLTFHYDVAMFLLQFGCI